MRVSREKKGKEEEDKNIYARVEKERGGHGQVGIVARASGIPLIFVAGGDDEKVHVYYCRDIINGRD